MLPLEHPDRIRVSFDDHRLVANAGLILPATLARHLGLSQLVDRHLDLGRAPGRANAGDKLVTLLASALAGGDCIDGADALRAGGTAQALGCVVKAPSTLGTFLRSFRWGHVRQLDRVSRELLSRAWAAGAGPGDASFTIDLDSTICETYGLTKEGARHHGYTGQRGYHPLLARAWATGAGTGDVLLARLREGRANTAPGAAHFLRETLGRVRYAGAKGQITVRADSGFYTHGVVSTCRRMKVRFSITIRQHQSLRNLIEAIPQDDRTPIPYWMDGAADVAEAEYTPFRSEAGAAPVRLIVRRVKPTPGTQLALFASYSYHAFITGRDGDTLELEADHRRHAEIENAIRDLKYGVGLNHLPSGSASSLSPDGSPARPAASPCTFPRAGPGNTSSAAPSTGFELFHPQPDGAAATDLTLRTIEYPRKLSPVLPASVSRCPVARQSRPASPLWAAIGAPGDCCRTPPATFMGVKPESPHPHIHHSPPCQHGHPLRWIQA